MVSYPTVNAGGWLNENPEEPEGCAGAAGAGGFAPKVNTPGLFGKLKLEVLLPNWNTEPGKMGLKQKAVRKLKFEFILSSKILMFFPLSLMIFSFLPVTQDNEVGGGGTPEVPDYYTNSA